MKISHIDLWSALLAQLKPVVSEQAFNAWFVPITPISLDDNKLVLGVPNEFFKDWVKERYAPFIFSHLGSVYSDKKIEVEFIVVPPTAQQVETQQASRDQNKKAEQKEKKGWFRSVFPRQTDENQLHEARLNPKYSFENFVVGAGNRFAHAASLAITESPAKAYNPFFIYGGVGLGKTHLMHAIGNELVKKSPKLKILYISSEEFTNELIGAIQNRSTQRFRQRYRNVDVLLIDDIHFIAGKESTQEEFFHTFNSLYDAHKQIVMSSDRSPKEIRNLEKRLVSRFEWGLITDIQPPDFETRIAILRKKSEKETAHLPDNLFFFLAEKIKTNIRELEGGLIRVIAYAKLMNKSITVDLAKEVLKGMIIEGERKIGVDLIQKKVAQYFDIGLEDMKAKKRTKAVAYPRQIAMYLSRGLTDLSLPEIGQFFGGRDHTTVLHACEKIEKILKTDDKAKWIVDKLIGDIKR
ncbi:MAG: chromosomal replication initiator protein DnaA [Candidatus Omnitrophica bacterium]|nr:chromosomal replication initiator protein DnaA [Candidatus Omnitrophota bacterium]